MKILGVLLGVLAIAAAGAALWYAEPWSSDEDSVDLSQLRGEVSGSSCRQVAGVSAQLSERDLAPVAFLRALGLQVAGIRPPPRAKIGRAHV